MTTTPDVHGRFLRLAGPNIMANLLVPLTSAVDVALLGHLAVVEDLAGVALATVLFDILLWGFGFLRMATTGQTAQARGRGDREDERTIAVRALLFGIGTGSIVVAAQWPLRELGFLVLQGGPALESAARAYFDARIWAAPFTLANYAWLGWLLGREQSTKALWLTASAQVANIVLDVIFIAFLGWGAAGAGAATALSQAVMFVAAIALTRRALPWAVIRHHLPVALRADGWGTFFGLGRDITIRTLLLVGTFAVFTNVAATMGAVTLAGVAVLRQVVMLAAWFVDGFAFAVESLVGVFAGASQPAQVRRVLRIATIWSVGASVAIALACALLPELILGLLVDHEPVLQDLRSTVWWLVPVLVFGAPAYVLDGLFLGLTAGGTLRRAMLWSTVLGFVPWIAVTIATGSVHWLWAALSIFMLARTLTLGRHVGPHLRRLATA